MKKLLAIVVLGLLWSVNAYANCNEYLDFSWKFVGKDRVTHVNEPRAHYAKFTFKSSSDKKIKIHYTILKTIDNKTVKKDEFNEFYIEPYGKDYDLMYGMQELNLDVVEYGNYSCSFQKVSTKSKTSTKSNTSTTNSNRSKNTNENSAAVLLVVFSIIGFIIYKLVGSNNSDSSLKKEKSKSKTKKDKVFYSEQYGWSFPGKYILFALPAIAGLMYFDNGFLKFIFGIYLLGCIIGFFKGDR